MGDYSEYANRELRKVNGIVNKIDSKRKYPGYHFISFLIVEGETDKKFYKTFVDSNKCQITIAEGKDNVREVLSILEKDNFPGILAIADADFDVLEGKP